MSDITKNKLAIYVHIPFCKSRCNYCNFCSSVCNDAKKIDDYFSSLEMEIRKSSKNYIGKVSSIYFGGGTPNFVDGKHIAKIIDCIKAEFQVSKNVEISIECNPSLVTFEKLLCYKKAGVNRVSFGVQSLFNFQLKKLSRFQTRKDVSNALKAAKRVGIKNISVDILLGLENQTKWQLFLQNVYFFMHGVKHISAYMLTIEQGTKLFDMVQAGIYKQQSDEHYIKLYNFEYRLLRLLGYTRYETSNFARCGFECKHNISYWNGTNYIGFGLSAHSLYNAKRWANTTSLDDYFSGQYVVFSENCNKDKQKEEFVMLSLRLKTGLDLDVYKNRFQEDLLERKCESISLLEKKKIISIKNNHLIVSPKYMGVLNQIILMLI